MLIVVTGVDPQPFSADDYYINKYPYLTYSVNTTTYLWANKISHQGQLITDGAAVSEYRDKLPVLLCKIIQEYVLIYI